jgi:hypothetical protein
MVSLCTLNCNNISLIYVSSIGNIRKSQMLQGANIGKTPRLPDFEIAPEDDAETITAQGAELLQLRDEVSHEDNCEEKSKKRIAAKVASKILQTENETQPPKRISDAYADFVEFSINSCGSLDIICRPWAPVCALGSIVKSPSQDKHTIPSWTTTDTKQPFLPNNRGIWSRANADPLVGVSCNGHNLKWTYNAAAGSRHQAVIDKSQSEPVLRARGISIDTIEEIGSIALEGIIPIDWTLLVGWKDLNHPPPSTFWKTIVGDRNVDSIGAPESYQRICQAAYHDRLPSGSLNISGLLTLPHISSAVVEYLNLAQAVVWGRRLIKTKSGLIGLADNMTRKGDAIAVLYGCTVPLILTGVGNKLLEDNQVFRLVGECYLHGFMNGEVYDRSIPNCRTFCIQ